MAQHIFHYLLVGDAATASHVAQRVATEQLKLPHEQAQFSVQEGLLILGLEQHFADNRRER